MQIKDSGHRRGFETGACKFIHGKTNTRLFSIWTNMHTRCHNKNNAKYKNYGARGIRICSEWEKDFMSFYDWSMENGYDDELTIDRVNNDGDYEPSNCRWVTQKIQQNNRTSNRLITHNGKTQTMQQWAIEKGIKYTTLRMRIEYGWSVDEAINGKKVAR